VQLVMRDGPSLLVWDVAGGREIATCRFAAGPGEHRVEKLALNEADVPVTAFSSDGSLVAAAATGPGDTGSLAVWDGTSGRGRFQVRATVGALAFAPDNTRLAAGTDDGRVTLWAVPQGEQLASWPISRLSIHGLAFDPGGRLLAVGDSGGEIRIADSETGRLLSLCHNRSKVYALAFSPDGTILASAGRNETGIWDVATGRCLLESPFGDYVTGLAFSPDGWVAASSISAFAAGKVTVWELKDDRGIRTFRGLSGLVQTGQFSPDRRWLAALSFNWQVGVWDVQTGRLRWRFNVPPGPYIDNAGLVFRGDGREIAFAGGKAARCWDLQTLKETGRWALPCEGLQDALAFPSPDLLLSFRVETRQGVPGPFSDAPSQKYPRVCRIRNLRGPTGLTAVAEIAAFNRGVFKARACPDGSCFSVFGPQDDAGGQRRVVKVFDARTGGERFSRPNTGGSIRFDPTGLLLALTSGESQSPLVDPASGSAEGSLPGRPLCIGPGASYLIYYRDDRRDPPTGLALVRRGDGAVLVVFGVDLSGDQMVTFNPAGDLLAWGTPEGVVFVANIERVRQRLAEVGLGR
jgi:hypothetical protein